MSLFRLLQSSLIVATLIAGASATSPAQSSPEKTPADSPSTGHLNTQENPRPNSPGAFLNAPTTLTVDKAQQMIDQVEDLGPRNCLKMRMYKVRRDDPHSDSTHLVGYSTCLPAARIQTYKVGERVQVSAP